ncbi:MAG: hypothetical protein MHPSP_002898, partial [Paramarteilia canceri]
SYEDGSIKVEKLSDFYEKTDEEFNIFDVRDSLVADKDEFLKYNKPSEKEILIYNELLPKLIEIKKNSKGNEAF